MNDTTTELSDTYIECFSGTLALQTQMTMGINHKVIETYLDLSKKIGWMMDQTSPEWWFDYELDGIKAVAQDCYKIGLQVGDWIAECEDPFMGEDE